MDISIFAIQSIIFLRTHQADAVFIISRRWQVLHEKNVHIATTDGNITFIYKHGVITEFLFGFGNQHLHLFRQDVLQTQQLHSMVISCIVVPQRIEHGNHTLPIHGIIPPNVRIYRPECPPDIAV